MWVHKTRDLAKPGIFDYIVLFYNRCRPGHVGHGFALDR